MAATEWASEWRHWARPAQLEPAGDWWIWLVRTGRGWGKSRTIMETARARIDAGVWRTVLAVAPTGIDVGLMVNGNPDANTPGLLDLWPAHQRPKYTESQQDPRVICHNGAVIRVRSAQRADRIRGINADGAICDEVDSWKPEKMTARKAFGLAEMTVRVGDDPKILASSTPKRGGLVAWLSQRSDVFETSGHMDENAENLSERWREAMHAQYDGTHLGRVELAGEIPKDVEGAIVGQAMIDSHRCQPDDTPEMVRGVVGVDPYGGGGDACGIVPVGKGIDGHPYVFRPRTNRLGPEGWGRVAVETALEHEFDLILVETNYGGNMAIAPITRAMADLGVRHVRVEPRTSMKSKPARFSPTAMYYERGEAHHVGSGGSFEPLEDQVCCFTPESYEGESSPNDADALVIAMAELFPAQVGATWGDLYPQGKEAQKPVAPNPARGLTP